MDNDDSNFVDEPAPKNSKNVEKSPIHAAQDDEEQPKSSGESELKPTANVKSNEKSGKLEEIPQNHAPRKMRHFEPGSSSNLNFRPSFHPRGGPYRQNNNFRMMNSVPPRFPMKNFPGDGGRPPNFFGFRPNRFHGNFQQGGPPHSGPPRFFKPNDLHSPRMMNPMPTHFLPRTPLITSNTANFQAASVPQKVLINPNFKGGVEAVKSKIYATC